MIPELPIQDVPLSDLHTNPKNPRRITPERKAALSKSLEREPSMLRARPLVALPDGTVIVGNMRLAVAQELGWESLPTVYVDLDDERAKLWMLRDNQEYGEWVQEDLEALIYELNEQSADLELTGFSNEKLEELLHLDKVAENGEDGQGDKLALMSVSLGEPRHKTERGEVWMLGDHHLVIEDVYTGWATAIKFLEPHDLFVPYPILIAPLTERAREKRFVMMQPDAWLAGHMLDKYAEINGEDTVVKL